MLSATAEQGPDECSALPGILYAVNVIDPLQSFEDRIVGNVLMMLGTDIIKKIVAVFGKQLDHLPYQAGFADTGFPDDQNAAPRPGDNSLPVTEQLLYFPLSVNPLCLAAEQAEDTMSSASLNESTRNTDRLIDPF